MNTTTFTSWVGLRLTLALLMASAFQILAQNVDATDSYKLAAQAAGYLISDAGPHHRKWQKTDEVVAGDGSKIQKVRSYTEIASGLNAMRNGAFVPAVAAFREFPGGIIADGMQYQVIVSRDAKHGNDPMVDMLLPDGQQRLQTRVIAIQYWNPDSNQSVVLAKLQDSTAQLVTPTKVVFPSALTGLVEADVEAEISLGKYEQNVVLRTAPPLPESLGAGFSSATTRLQIWTEVIDPPTPKSKVSVGQRGQDGRMVMKELSDSAQSTTNRNGQVTHAGRANASEIGESGTTILDEILDFNGSMAIPPGRAFLVGQPNGGLPGSGPATRVFKRWFKSQGRTFIVESALFVDAQSLLSTLPPKVASTAPPAIRRGPGMLIPAGDTSQKVAQIDENPFGKRLEEITAEKAVASVPNASRLLASAGRPGVVWDYSSITSSADFVCQGDTTYLLDGNFYVTGSLTIEPGSVIKGTSGSWVDLWSGVLNCKTSMGKPAHFTDLNDDSVGEVISGSSHSPTTYGGWTALAVSPTGQHIHDLRISYYYYGLFANDPTISNVQIVNCGTAIRNEYSTATIRNCLLANIGTAFDGFYFNIKSEHLTVGTCTTSLAVDSYGASHSALYFTNSILAGVASFGSISRSSAYTYESSSTSGLWQSVGNGNYYLADGSPYRNAGTSIVTPAMGSILKQSTTYPPTVISGTEVYDNILSPQAQRDTDTPDYGYHFPCADYLANGYVIPAGVTVTLTNGVVVLVSGNPGILVQGTGALISEGKPEAYNRIIRDTVVFEGHPSWSGTSPDGYVDVKGAYASGYYPAASFRFTDFHGWAGGGKHIQCNYVYLEGFSTLTIRDSSFGPGSSYFNAVSSGQTIDIQNTLFERTRQYFFGYQTFNYYNNLTWRGTIYFIHNGGTWTVRDNSFDTCTLTDVFGGTSNDHNAFIGGSSTLGSSSGSDVTLSACPYLAGPFGPYYQAGTHLRDKGSRYASAASLFHFEAERGHKEGSSLVDIGLHYPSAGSESYTASDGFSTSNGQNNWWYLYASSQGAPSMSNQLTYDSGYNWWGGISGDFYCLVWSTGMHPGNTYDSVRAFVAPRSGAIEIASQVQGPHLACGTDSPVQVRVRKNTTDLTSGWVTIPKDDTTWTTVNASTTVAAGDVIYFQVTSLGNNGCDTTAWNPTITYSDPVVETVWVEDSPPPGGYQPYDGGDSWSWVTNPPQYSGTQQHQSANASGEHQHYFYASTSTLSLTTNDTLFCYVYLDPGNVPSELMFQWRLSDGSDWKRAYWGSDLITGWGARTYIGALPPSGGWVRLEVPVTTVGLDGSTIDGMAFTLYNGRAYYDRAGKAAPADDGALSTDTDSDGIPDVLEDRNGNGSVDSGETDFKSYNSPNALTGTLGLQVYTPLK